VGFTIEGGVEGQDGARAFEAVACEVQFFHCMYYSTGMSVSRSCKAREGLVKGRGIMVRRTVLHVHLNSRSIRRLAHPQI
jgi:hypothetical protein